MRRVLVVTVIGVLLGLGVVWMVMSQMPPPREESPMMNGIRRPNLPRQPGR